MDRPILSHDFDTRSGSSQYGQYVRFESRMVSFMDGFIYPKLNWKVNRNPNYHRDLTITKPDGSTATVEEKFRTNIYKDMVVELLQDAEYKKDFHVKQLGWFYNSTSDYLMYTFSQSISSSEPKIVYLVSFNRLRANFKTLIGRGSAQKLVSSVRGTGTSINISFSWEDLQLVDIARKII